MVEQISEERITVWKHSLENTASYLARTKYMCHRLHERIDTLSDKARMTDTVGVRELTVDDLDDLFDMSNILDMMHESLEHHETFMYQLARNPAYSVRQPEPIAPSTYSIRKSPIYPPDLDFSVYDDISTEELFLEMKRQDAIVEAASLDSVICYDAIQRRGRA